jgi:hypothetical protein
MHKRLKGLALSHARVDLKLSACDWVAKLFRTLDWAERLHLELELGLYFTKSAKKEIKDLFSFPPLSRQKIARLLIFERNTDVASAALLETVRREAQKFRPGIPIGAGTDADFYQLNQFRPPLKLCDCICWSINPQVHAVDNTSLVETPEAIPHQIESARSYFPGKALAISPITLRPRFNPVATGPEEARPAGDLPPDVDPRQSSLLGAGWTLAMLKRLAESGAESVTLFENIGWRGVMETTKGSPLPDKFKSIPSAVFPLYHVLAWIGEFAAGQVMISNSNEPLKVESLVLAQGQRSAVVLANLTRERQIVRLCGLDGDFTLKRLDETNAEQAMVEPEEFRDQGEKIRAERGQIEIELMPYGLARVASANK